jgi:hypothetical protein
MKFDLRTKLLAGAAMTFLGLSTAANAAPTSDPSVGELGTSSCSGPNGSLVCNIYEGLDGEISSLELPQVESGFVVLLDNGDNRDITNWSDVAEFFFCNNTQSSCEGSSLLTFYSDPSTFPVINNGTIFLAEDPSGVTLYPAGGNNYFFHSAADRVPEPGTLLLFGGALAGLGIIRWRRRKGASA